MTDRVTRSPVRLCSRDGKICYYRRLEYTVSCFCVLLPSFLLLLRPYSNFGMFLLVVRAAVICSTSASTCVLESLVSIVFCLTRSQNSFCFIFFILHFSYFLLFLAGAFFVLSYPVRTLAFYSICLL